MSVKKGFTLLEIIVVVVILGVLGVIAIPRFVKLEESAIVKEAVASLDILHRAQNRWAIEHSSGGLTDCAALDIQTRPQNFNAPVCTDPKISMTRKATAYTLSVDTSGCFSCSGLCPANTSKLLPVGPSCPSVVVIPPCTPHCGFGGCGSSNGCGGTCNGMCIMNINPLQCYQNPAGNYSCVSAGCGGVTCPIGQTCCGNVGCVDLLNNDLNCGGCHQTYNTLTTTTCKPSIKCVNGAFSLTNASLGVDCSSMQAPVDACHLSQCDGNGGCASVNGPAGVDCGSTQCSVNLCNASGGCIATPVADQTTCSSGAGVCCTGICDTQIPSGSVTPMCCSAGPCPGSSVCYNGGCCSADCSTKNNGDPDGCGGVCSGVVYTCHQPIANSNPCNNVTPVNNQTRYRVMLSCAANPAYLTNPCFRECAAGFHRFGLYSCVAN